MYAIRSYYDVLKFECIDRKREKTMKIIKKGMFLYAFFCLFSAMATEPTISNVAVRQHWPWSRLVDIDYELTCDLSYNFV